MADLFTVIADPTRRDLLGLLLRGRPGEIGVGEISVGEMVSALGVSQPTVSKHLKVLREAGLVRVREKGQHRYYSVDPDPLLAVADWLEPFVEEARPDIRLAPVGLVAVPPRGSGVPLPAPLRRAAENLPDVGEVGTTLGRVVAGAQNRIPGPIKKRLGHREQG